MFGVKGKSVCHTDRLNTQKATSCNLNITFLKTENKNYTASLFSRQE